MFVSNEYNLIVSCLDKMRVYHQLLLNYIKLKNYLIYVLYIRTTNTKKFKKTIGFTREQTIE